MNQTPVPNINLYALLAVLLFHCRELETVTLDSGETVEMPKIEITQHPDGVECIVPRALLERIATTPYAYDTNWIVDGATTVQDPKHFRVVFQRQDPPERKRIYTPQESEALRRLMGNLG